MSGKGKPGSRWRVLAWTDGVDPKHSMENVGIFDEVVVDHWLHVEQMDTNVWWMNIAGLNLNVRVDSHGRGRIVSGWHNDAQAVQGHLDALIKEAARPTPQPGRRMKKRRKAKPNRGKALEHQIKKALADGQRIRAQMDRQLKVSPALLRRTFTR